MTQAALIPVFLQIPYKHMGRNIKGADCWGTIMLWYWMRMGIKIQDAEGEYPPSWEWEGKSVLLENASDAWEKVETPGIYDVILFETNGLINHAGIYLKEGRFMHTTKAGTIISKLDEHPFTFKVHSCYHLKERHAS